MYFTCPNGQVVIKSYAQVASCHRQFYCCKQDFKKRKKKISNNKVKRSFPANYMYILPPFYLGWGGGGGGGGGVSLTIPVMGCGNNE